MMQVFYFKNETFIIATFQAMNDWNDQTAKNIIKYAHGSYSTCSIVMTSLLLPEIF